jgi:raffinose/stachyose/melibiose transport system permease protein
VKSIPRDVEESAYIDGCSIYGVFWRIIFPLLQPITITAILLNSLWIWNDFLLPLIFIFGKGARTIPLAVYSFFGEYSRQWDFGLAGLVMGIIPLIVFFIFVQKYVISGILAGSIKG